MLHTTYILCGHVRTYVHLFPLYMYVGIGNMDTTHSEELLQSQLLRYPDVSSQIMFTYNLCTYIVRMFTFLHLNCTSE